MSIFRSPVYLDSSLLVPIVGRYDIEVLVDTIPGPLVVVKAVAIY